MNMEAYTNSVKTLDISRSRRKEAATKAADEEYKQYRSFAGSIMCL